MKHCIKLAVLALLAGCNSPSQPKRLAELDLATNGPVVFSQDSGFFAAGGPDGRIAIYDATGKTVAGPPGGSGALDVLALSGDQLAYARALQPTLEVWNLKTRSPAGRITLGEMGQQARKIHHQAELWSDGHSAMVSKGSYAYVDGKQAGHLNYLAYRPGSLLFANDDRGQLCWLQGRPPKVSGILPAAPGGGYGCVAISADGKRLAASTTKGELLIFDVAERRLLSRFALRNLKHMSFSPDGTTLAISAASVHLLEAASGEPLAEWPLTTRQVRFRPDGQWLAAYGNESQIWDTKTLQQVSAKGGYQDLDFLGNSGKFLAVAYDKADLVDGAQQKTLAEIPGSFVHVTVSPNGKLATLAPRNAKLQLWSLP